MPSHRPKKTTAATAAAGPSRSEPEPSNPEIEEEEEEIEEEEDNDDERPEPSEDQALPQWAKAITKRLTYVEKKNEELATANDLLRRENEIQRREIDLLRKETAGASTSATEQENERAKLLENYPDLAQLKPYWPAKFKKLFPLDPGAGKPSSLELLMETEDRTYMRLKDEKKDAQRNEYSAALTCHTWQTTYCNALKAFVDHLGIEDEQDTATLRKLFNGMRDALELGALRISYLQIRAFPEEYEDSFQEVFTSTINQRKLSDQLVSREAAQLHDQYVKLRRDKTLAVAAKQGSQAKANNNRASTSNQTAGAKPSARRADRKKPEERPAPQA